MISRAALDLYDDSNFDHLFSRQVKVGAGPLGYLFQEYEEAFAPERHARCRRGQGTDSTQKVRGIAEGNREAGRSAGRQHFWDFGDLHEAVTHR